MDYKLVVTKMEKNPKYSQKQDPYYQRQEEPQFITHDEILNVCLSESEFKAIKKAVIEVIE